MLELLPLQEADEPGPVLRVEALLERALKDVVYWRQRAMVAEDYINRAIQRHARTAPWTVAG